MAAWSRWVWPLATAPFVANLLGAFAGRFGPRSGTQLALTRGIGATALIAVVVLPLPAVMIGVAVVYWLSLSLGSPFHLRLWGSMYPARVRGRVVGVLGMGRAAAGALATLAGGIVADRLGGEVAVALAGLVGLVTAASYGGLRAPTPQLPPSFSARGSILALRERPVLARVALAQGFYGGGLIAAAPAVRAGPRGPARPVDGPGRPDRAVDRGRDGDRVPGVGDRHIVRCLTAMRAGSVAGVASLVAYAVAPDLAILLVAAVAAGIASASIDVGIAGVISDQTTLAARAAATAGWNAVTGARGIVTAFAMSALLQVGLVDVTGGLLLCAVTSTIGVALFARARRESRSRRARGELAISGPVDRRPDARPAAAAGRG